MKDLSLTFRPASLDDLGPLWQLLHANSFGWPDSKIIVHIHRLYLLTRGTTLIGALLAGERSCDDIRWTAVHPLYPEKPFTALLTEGFRGLQASETSRRLPLKSAEPVCC